MRMIVTALTGATLLLTGCANFQTTPPSPVDIAGMQGKVIGGQQPISHALVQIYQAGTTGYGTGATGLISGGGVYTDANGNFSISGLYSCTSGSQVYITATGGNPGFGGNNPASVILAGLGLCDNVGPSTFIQMNEVTTVGTAYALAQFMNGTNIGAPSTNQAALAQAFADINILTDTGRGVSPGPSAPANATVPSGEIYAIANSIAACVNSNGSGTACNNLFAYTTPAGGSAPTDVLGATINIATGRYPVANTNNILALAAATPPFASNFTSATDLTLSVTYSGGGMASPNALAIDATGNVWITNANNSVTKLSHSGAVLSGSGGYTVGGLNGPTAIAIDATGNAWITNSNNAIVELTPAGAAAAASPFTGGGLASPTSIAFDAFGNSWIANAASNAVSVFSASGSPVSANGYAATGLSAPVGVAVTTK